MAVDEALLEAAATKRTTTLRFYRWSEPTLSLGYFQAAADRERHAASRDCPLVRRASGGGAILHDDELTYSMAIPSRGRFGDQAAALYDAFHETLIAALASFGVVATQCSCATGTSPEPFLCFQRQTCGDVLLGSDKIAGSAQRRSRGALLQHGSVLLARSDHAPELPGINDLASPPLPLAAESLIAAWLPLVSVTLACHFQHQCLSPPERQQAAEIAAYRFAQPAWNARR
jgi:lipoate-protein ligase A